ncbi:hypothetical protein [Humisphaera borealis]|uniref:Uncharacterized protein n=1 Tax=Humisphaera borealis TaxID=2807512 RepID=A0A7M2WUP2_9BACT|nr:hypothetical protein [Humisphaera borealis]QOV89113.1 hypothetical protein IPV69_23300 [Humisphaera borealis]
MTALPTQSLLSSSSADGARQGDVRSPLAFVLACLGVVTLAAVLAGFVPIGFSIVTVFLFAGPHNWLELRYFLAKMPARWGPLKPFFTLAIGGVLVLTAGFIAMALVGRSANWAYSTWSLASSVWNSALVLWVATLTWMRGRQTPRRDWSWALPAGLAVVAVVWIFPVAWELGLVYLHPLIALVFLDREIVRRRPSWRRAYHVCLLALPVCLVLLWWRLAGAAPLAGQDMLTMRITQHAGADILHNLSPHLLVATHTFLEMVHYGVWVVAIPLIAMKTAPWQLTSVPLARRSWRWRTAVVALLVCGGGVVVTLWAGFIGDYALTRDIYFTIAIAHVLAEFPFLLRMH